MSDDASLIGRSRSAAARRWPALPVPLVGLSRRLSRRVSVRRIADSERERLFLWGPVAFGAGIAAYFALPREPVLAAVLVPCVVTGIVAVRCGPGRLGGIAFIGLFLASLGMLDAGLRSRWVAAPVVSETGYPVPVTGRIIGVDLREDGAARLTVAPERIGRDAAAELPTLLSLWMRGSWSVPAPGQAVRFDAMLLPPPDAAVPGGFDYARRAWFAGIGGVGFLTSAPKPVQTARAPELPVRLGTAIERTRLSIAARIRQSLPGSVGAIAAALVTGERGAIPDADEDALRASGLAHILAISGLHMMLVVGTLFWFTRACLALSPDLALTRPIKKWAAAIALIGGLGYLVLSGASIATQRAFIMAAIMLVAVLLDRPAITLRNVAIAASIVLVLTPEALVTASFQMSFAATVALVSAYEALRWWSLSRGESAMAPPVRFLVRAVLGLVFTALIAGLATGPFAAYHFNRVAVYGLIANVAAMPLVSVLVMPSALAAVLLMPFGLEGLALVPMGLGIEGVLAVARTVAGWEGAVRMVSQVPVAALLLTISGGLWLLLWRTGVRLLGVPFIAAGVVLSAVSDPPDLFVARDLRMAALRMQDGALAFLPKPGSDYEVEVWLRSAGLVPEGTPRRRAACDTWACVADNGRLRVSYVSDPVAFAEDCAWADVVVTPISPPQWCRDDAIVIGPQDAARSGAITLTKTANGIAIETAADRSGDRPWTRRGP